MGKEFSNIPRRAAHARTGCRRIGSRLSCLDLILISAPWKPRQCDLQSLADGREGTAGRMAAPAKAENEIVAAHPPTRTPDWKAE